MSDKKEKGEENAVSDYISKNRHRVCKLFDAVLCELESKERLQNAPLNQLVSTLGTLIDKFGQSGSDQAAEHGSIDDIMKKYKDII